MSRTIALKTHQYLGEFKTGRKCLQGFKRAKITRGEYRKLPCIQYFYSTFFFYRFVQFIGSLGGVDVDPTCFTPRSPEHSVILQYSNNGGKLGITFHLFQKRDLKV